MLRCNEIKRRKSELAPMLRCADRGLPHLPFRALKALKLLPGDPAGCVSLLVARQYPAKRHGDGQVRWLPGPVITHR